MTESIKPSIDNNLYKNNDISSEFPLACEELILNIFRFLSILDLGRVACASQQLKKIAEDDSIWREITLQAFALNPCDEKIVSISWKNIYRSNKQNLDSMRNNNCSFRASLDIKGSHQTHTVIFEGKNYFIVTYSHLTKISLIHVDRENGFVAKDVYSSPDKLNSLISRNEELFPSKNKFISLKTTYLNLGEKTNNKPHLFVVCIKSKTTILFVDPFQRFENIEFLVPDTESMLDSNFGIFEYEDTLYLWVCKPKLGNSHEKTSELWDISRKERVHCFSNGISLSHIIGDEKGKRQGYQETFKTRENKPVIFVESNDSQQTIGWDPLLNQKSTADYLSLSTEMFSLSDESGREFIVTLTPEDAKNNIEIVDKRTWNPITKFSIPNSKEQLKFQIHRGGEYLTAFGTSTMLVIKQAELILNQTEFLTLCDISIFTMNGKDFLFVGTSQNQYIRHLDASIDSSCAILWDLETGKKVNNHLVGVWQIAKSNQNLSLIGNGFEGGHQKMILLHPKAKLKNATQEDNGKKGESIIHRIVPFSPNPSSAKTNSTSNNNLKTIAKIALIVALILVSIWGLQKSYPYLLRARPK
jgi:hypothetical protein